MNICVHLRKKLLQTRAPDFFQQSLRRVFDHVEHAIETAGATESFTETPPVASSWDKPSEPNNDGWHTPSSPTSGHDETQHAPDSGESAPKPELVQVETRFDEDDKGNK